LPIGDERRGEKSSMRLGPRHLGGRRRRKKYLHRLKGGE